MAAAHEDTGEVDGKVGAVADGGGDGEA